MGTDDIFYDVTDKLHVSTKKKTISYTPWPRIFSHQNEPFRVKHENSTILLFYPNKPERPYEMI